MACDVVGNRDDATVTLTSNRVVKLARPPVVLPGRGLATRITVMPLETAAAPSQVWSRLIAGK